MYIKDQINISSDLMTSVHCLMDDLKSAYMTHYGAVETPYPSAYQLSGTRADYTVEANMKINRFDICIKERFSRPRVVPSIFDEPKEILHRKTLVNTTSILSSGSHVIATVLKEPVFRADAVVTPVIELYEHIMDQKMVSGFSPNAGGRYSRVAYAHDAIMTKTTLDLHKVGNKVILEENQSTYMHDVRRKKHTHMEWTPRYNADGKFECEIQGIIATDIIQCVIRDANTAMRFVTTDGVLVEI